MLISPWTVGSMIIVLLIFLLTELINSFISTSLKETEKLALIMSNGIIRVNKKIIPWIDLIPLPLIYMILHHLF